MDKEEGWKARSCGGGRGGREERGADMKPILIIYLPIAVLAIILLFYPVRHLVAVRIARKKSLPKPSRWLLLAWLIYGFSLLVFVVLGVFGFEWKARASEARVELASIYKAQLNYHRETGSFAGGSNAFELLGWKPEIQNMYAYYCGDDWIKNKKSDPVLITPGPNWPYPERSATTAHAFACMAIGNCDADPFLDIWMIDQNKVLRHLYDDRDNIREGGTDPDMVRLTIWAVVAALFVAGIVADEVRTKRPPQPKVAFALYHR